MLKHISIALLVLGALATATFAADSRAKVKPPMPEILWGWQAGAQTYLTVYSTSNQFTVPEDVEVPDDDFPVSTASLVGLIDAKFFNFNTTYTVIAGATAFPARPVKFLVHNDDLGDNNEINLVLSASRAIPPGGGAALAFAGNSTARIRPVALAPCTLSPENIKTMTAFIRNPKLPVFPAKNDHFGCYKQAGAADYVFVAYDNTAPQESTQVSGLYKLFPATGKFETLRASTENVDEPRYSGVCAAEINGNTAYVFNLSYDEIDSTCLYAKTEQGNYFSKCSIPTER